MQQYFVDRELNLHDKIQLNQEQSHHIKDVLRMKQGAVIRIANQSEDVFFAHIEFAGKDIIACLDEEVITIKSPIEITLAQALIKGEKWDYLLQKVCELGVHKIQPILTSRCVVKVKDEKSDKKLQRWNKIALEACEQCKRVSLVQVSDVCSYKDIADKTYDLKLLAYELADHTTMKLKDVLDANPKVKRILCIVGPEGGFSEDEVEYLLSHGFTCISLGTRILRAETAALAMVHALTYTFDC